MLVMGISCHYHDSAVAIIDENEIAFAIHEERLSRVKHDRRFPALAAARGLQACGIDINDVAEVVFYENPELKLKRLWDQVVDYWPRSRGMFEREIPRFVHHKLPVDAQIRNHLSFQGRVQYSEHHRSHAASAFFATVPVVWTASGEE
jgi:carbamoyltransferase